MEWRNHKSASGGVESWSISEPGVFIRVSNRSGEGWKVAPFGRKNFGADLEAAKLAALKKAAHEAEGRRDRIGQVI